MLFQLLIMALPWRMRRRLLVWRYHWHIDPSAHIGMSIILAKEVELCRNSRILSFVLCRRIDRLYLGEDAGIASLTFITGYPTGENSAFSHLSDRHCELVLERSSGITSRHYVDCNGGIYVGAFTTIAGVRSQILTHSIDVYRNRQDAKPVRFGRYCFVGTGCIILPGAVLPDYCILGAGSVLNKSYTDGGMLYAGVPAIPRKALDVEEIPYFHRIEHNVE